LLDPSTLLIALALDIVGVSRAFLPALGLVTRLQLEIAQLPSVLILSFLRFWLEPKRPRGS